MESNFYLTEKLAEAHRQELLREAELQGLMKGVPRSRFKLISWSLAFLGRLFVEVETRLKRVTPSDDTIAHEVSE
jgi:hypothetical protein